MLMQLKFLSRNWLLAACTVETTTASLVRKAPDLASCKHIESPELGHCFLLAGLLAEFKILGMPLNAIRRKVEVPQTVHPVERYLALFVPASCMVM